MSQSGENWGSAVTPAGHGLVRSIPVTVVRSRTWHASIDNGGKCDITPLTAAEIASLTAYRERRPLGLVEHLDSQGLARLAFLRWLRATGRCPS